MANSNLNPIQIGTHSEEVETIPCDIEDNEIKRGRKKVSKVWTEFQIINIQDRNEVVQKYECRHCKKKYAASKSGITTHLKRHLDDCLYYRKQHKNQKNISLLPSDSGDGETVLSFSSQSFDMSKIREVMAKMITVHEYPFSMVEHFWFNVLMKSMNSQYERISRNTAKSDCLRLHEIEKEKLKKNLKNVERVCLTSDTWTSNQTIGYMCLTVHFIDLDWKLQKRIISFYELEPPHTGIVISDAISECLLLDNATTNDVVARSLKSNFESRGKLHYKGHIFHIRCCAHILNLMVQDGLKEIDGIIHNIRETVKYLKKSPSRLFKFGEVARQLNNSTYEMLDCAFNFRTVFDQYAIRNANYKWLPTSEDWKNAKKVAEFLEIFYDVTHLFSGCLYPTANRFLPEVWKVKEVLNIHSKSSDLFLRNVATVMGEKFDKYWKDCSMLMAIAAVLYPRYKMMLINFCFPLIYPDFQHIEKIVQLKQVMVDVFETYASENANEQPSSFAGCFSESSISVATSSRKPKSRGRSEFAEFKRKNDLTQPMKSDLEIYLEEGTVEWEQEDATFDVLVWWQLNSLKFRTLSRMASDLLTIPMTTVASESAFSAGGRVLDKFRSSLAPKIVEALVCTADWLRATQKNTKTKTSNSSLHVCEVTSFVTAEHFFR
ncbi:Tam3-transposase (Ac family) protein [Dioscorea alata]|uniref:Tam3-transposase (Ac family) protein n=1 Tax=Dioscorea alata TaxID=55571 RepID=A0ACB7TZ44_DIOAL|nr:Tam3-transposase (Ac family) protein [Dioscorea alata]